MVWSGCGFTRPVEQSRAKGPKQLPTSPLFLQRSAVNQARCQLSPFSISNVDFNEGRKESKYRYPIVKLSKLVKPITLQELTSRWGVKAPMGWSYVKKGMWLDRWGLDDERSDKVEQILG